MPLLKSVGSMPSDTVFELSGVFKLTGSTMAPTKEEQGSAAIVKSGPTYQCVLRWTHSNYPIKKMKLSGNIKESMQRKDRLTVALKNNLYIIGKDCNPAQVKEFISILDGIERGCGKYAPHSQEEKSDDEKENKPLSHALERKINTTVGKPASYTRNENISENQSLTPPRLFRSFGGRPKGRILVASSQKTCQKIQEDSVPVSSRKDNKSSGEVPSSSNTNEQRNKTNAFYGSSMKLPSASETFRRFSPSLSSRKDSGSVFRSYSFRNRDKLPDIYEPSALVGFQNLGNTCYMNAILQTLLSLPTFAADLENCSYTTVQSNTLQRSLCSLLNSIKNRDSKEKRNLILQRIKQKISFAANRFSGSLQHDAHEFLCQCFDQLKEEANKGQVCAGEEKETSKKEETTKKEEKKVEENKSENDKPSSNGSVGSCPVRRNFECEVSHTIECSQCKHKVIKEETMHDFSLNIPDIDDQTHGIDDLLLDYFEEEKVEYTCEHCDSNTSTLSHLFSKLPRVITLHLKRYQYDAGISKNNKKQNRIGIPKVLEIGRLCRDETSLPPEFAKHDQQKQRCPPKRALSPGAEDTESGPNAKVRRRLAIQDAETNKIVGTHTSARCILDESPTSFHSPKIQRVLAFDSDRNERCSDNSKEFSQNPVEQSEAMIGFTPLHSRNDVKSSFQLYVENNSRKKETDVTGLANPLSFDMLEQTHTNGNETLQSCKQLDGTKLIAKDLRQEKISCDDELTKCFFDDNSMVQPTTKEEEDKQMQLALERSLINEPVDNEMQLALETSLTEYKNELERRDALVAPAERNCFPSKKVRRSLPISCAPRRYQLVAIINHIGYSTNVGHYTCDVLDLKTKEWRSCNDSSIKMVTEHEVRHGRAHTAYILFYMFEDHCKIVQGKEEK